MASSTSIAIPDPDMIFYLIDGHGTPLSARTFVDTDEAEEWAVRHYGEAAWFSGEIQLAAYCQSADAEEEVA